MPHKELNSFLHCFVLHSPCTAKYFFGRVDLTVSNLYSYERLSNFRTFSMETKFCLMVGVQMPNYSCLQKLNLTLQKIKNKVRIASLLNFSGGGKIEYFPSDLNFYRVRNQRLHRY